MKPIEDRRVTTADRLRALAALLGTGFLFLGGCAGLLVAPDTAFSCIHSPADYRGAPVSEQEKVALLFHDGVNAHLTIRTTLATRDALPDHMAWVIPLPSLPSRYEESPVELFEELFRLIPRDDPRLEMAPQAAAKAEAPKTAPAPAILVHETQVVGNYQLQPVEILRESAGSELNAWLIKNGFGAVPPENQKYYLRRGAVFLAVQVRGLKGRESELKPLHIVYRDDRLRLPLKFSTHSGEFGVRLYTVTNQAPSRAALEAFGLHVGGRSYRIASHNELAATAPSVARMLGDRLGFVTEFRGDGYNATHRVASWQEDPWLAPDGGTPRFAPGGPDSAASWPDYPLVGFRPEDPFRRREASMELWFWRAALSVGFAGLIWWVYRAARQIGIELRTRSARAALPASVGNRTMVLGIAATAAYVCGAGLVISWHLWGSLIRAADETLVWLGPGVVALGALLRIVSWVIKLQSD